MEPKIQRFCWFDTIPKADYVWKYKRAIEGHKFILDQVQLIVESKKSGVEEQIFQIYEGHTYSVWGSYPNIFDQASIGIALMTHYNPSHTLDLRGYETKELTMSWHNTNASNNCRNVAILYFYEVPMSKEEVYEYATKQPRYKIRHGSMRTAEEGGGYG